MAIIVVGGLGSIPGAAIAALLLGVAQSLLQLPLGPTWAQTVFYVALFATLMFRPQGSSEVVLPSVSEQRLDRPPWAHDFEVGGHRPPVGAALVLSFPTIAPNPYILSAGVVILNYAVLSTGWNFMGGFTGYISLGHAAYFGLGAYGTGLLIKFLDLPGFLAWILAAVLVAVIAIPIGIAALRVRGASFVIVSIAFVLIMLLVFQSWRDVTGGSEGLNVPRPFDVLRPEHHRIFYYLFAGLLAVALVVWWIIDRSSSARRSSRSAKTRTRRRRSECRPHGTS